MSFSLKMNLISTLIYKKSSPYYANFCPDIKQESWEVIIFIEDRRIPLSAWLFV